MVGFFGCVEPAQVEALKHNQRLLQKRAERIEILLDRRSASQRAQKQRSGAERLSPKNSFRAPDKFAVRFVTTQGDVIVDLERAWAPLGVDRFYSLVKMGYFEDIAIFRVIKNFVAQFGIHGDPKVSKVWKSARIKDDKVVLKNERGVLVFGTSGPHTRTTQLYFNLKDNKHLDGMGFAGIGKARNPEVLDRFFQGYGEGVPRGEGPPQRRIQEKGNGFLKAEFPKMDYIIRIELL